MKSKDSRQRARARSLCADLHPDDGPPARRRKETRDRACDDRKTMQLCAQVRRALHGVIPVPSDPFFDGLIVETVEPDPDATRLRVVISVPPSSNRSLRDLKRRLADMTGFIRSQVAPQIHRKRVPLLTFDFIPREERDT